MQAAVDVAIRSDALGDGAGMSRDQNGGKLALAVQKALDASWRSSRRAISGGIEADTGARWRTIWSRKIADDVASGVDPPSHGRQSACNADQGAGYVNGSELAAAQEKSVGLANGIYIRADDVAAWIDSLGACRSCNAVGTGGTGDIYSREIKGLRRSLRAEKQQTGKQREKELTHIFLHLSPPEDESFLGCATTVESSETCCRTYRESPQGATDRYGQGRNDRI